MRVLILTEYSIFSAVAVVKRSLGVIFLCFYTCMRVVVGRRQRFRGVPDEIIVPAPLPDVT